MPSFVPGNGEKQLLRQSLAAGGLAVPYAARHVSLSLSLSLFLWERERERELAQTNDSRQDTTKGAQHDKSPASNHRNGL